MDDIICFNNNKMKYLTLSLLILLVTLRISSSASSEDSITVDSVLEETLAKI